jgi:TatD DNase family protein
MTLIDSHSHLYLPEFESDRDAVVQRSVAEGVSRILLPNIDLDSFPDMLKMCESYPGVCFPMIGLHPTSVRKDYQQVLERMETYFSNHPFVAIGETGIDLYWDKTYQKEQEEAFSLQIALALERDLPLVIHARESFTEIFRILDRLWQPELKGVFHSFTGGAEEVKKVLGYGFYFGINGIVTFKNSELQETIKLIPPTRLLLETDSPFLAPVPRRGKRNESSYLRFICAKIAEIRGTSVSEIAASTTANAQKLFKL